MNPHLKRAYERGAATAQQRFEKEARFWRRAVGETASKEAPLIARTKLPLGEAHVSPAGLSERFPAGVEEGALNPLANLMRLAQGAKGEIMAQRLARQAGGEVAALTPAQMKYMRQAATKETPVMLGGHPEGLIREFPAGTKVPYTAGEAKLLERGGVTPAELQKHSGVLKHIVLPGAALGGVTGAIAGDEGSRLQSALLGAGLGGVLGFGGGVGGSVLGLGSRGRQLVKRMRDLKKLRQLSTTSQIPRRERLSILEELGARNPAEEYSRINRNIERALTMGQLAGGVGGGVLAAKAMGKSQE